MINQKIFKELKKNYEYLNYLDCKTLQEIELVLSEIEGCSKKKFDEISKNVINIVGSIVSSNGKKELYKYIAQLANVESNIRGFEFSPKREHVAHSLMVFITGIYINEFFMSKHDSKVNEFQWKLSSLFHDIGYANSMIYELMYHQKQTMNEIINNLTGSNLNENIFDYCSFLLSLNQDKNSFDIIYDRLLSWDLDVETIDKHIRSEKEIDHGVMSSLMLLFTLDQIYQRYNPKRKKGDFFANVQIQGDKFRLNCSQDIFENDITDVCAAIFVHNLPEKCFLNKKIKMNIKNSKLAYLLKLTDELQDWSRISYDSNSYNSSTQYDIDVNDHKLLITTTEKIISKINKTLEPQELIVLVSM